MTQRPPLEVADLVRTHGSAVREAYGCSPDQGRVLRDLAQCRTAALGGHVDECERCGERRISYNSCRNRHCPKCQGSQAAEWVDAQNAHLLPVPYVHVVFTLPRILSPLALQNPRLVYGLLFRAASRTLLDVAADERHLGARIGVLAVLHTWGQTLAHHPHLHCVVPAGGLSLDGARWVACRSNFFLPVRVLSSLFRGRFLALLDKAFADGRLAFHGALRPFADAPAFARLLRQARALDWVVYAKPPFGGPEQVLKYLARYTHRVAISNRRLLDIDDGVVSFRYKDYARGNRWRTQRLDAVEFLRRFLLHVLPSGFVRIRRYGLLANARREMNLACCRALLNTEQPRDQDALDEHAGDAQPMDVPERETPGARCPVCGDGRMRPVKVVLPARYSPSLFPSRLQPP
ncbi:MAG: IS91 family transposase [Proteobacteria bacterium]|nr:IS91 family transposase [Pseudomonadota bacterium]